VGSCGCHRSGDQDKRRPQAEGDECPLPRDRDLSDGRLRICGFRRRDADGFGQQRERAAEQRIEPADVVLGVRQLDPSAGEPDASAGEPDASDGEPNASDGEPERQLEHADELAPAGTGRLGVDVDNDLRKLGDQLDERAQPGARRDGPGPGSGVDNRRFGARAESCAGPEPDTRRDSCGSVDSGAGGLSAGPGNLVRARCRACGTGPGSCATARRAGGGCHRRHDGDDGERTERTRRAGRRHGDPNGERDEHARRRSPGSCVFDGAQLPAGAGRSGGASERRAGPDALAATQVASCTSSGPDVQLAHTSALDEEALRAVRGLLDSVFGAEMTDDDWEHALGGMHALLWEANELVGHGSVIQRRLLHDGHTLRAGYVEAVAVRADRRGRGYGAAVMEPLERVVRGAYEVGALGASEMGAGFYAARGWRQWRGRTWGLTPTGIVRTASEDEDVYVMEVSATLDLTGDLTCDWRGGDLW
jgi:aminoglycoside 2'-N-acetyltransferase I